MKFTFCEHLQLDRAKYGYVKRNPFKKDTWEYHAFVFMFRMDKPKK